MERREGCEERWAGRDVETISKQKEHRETGKHCIRTRESQGRERKSRGLGRSTGVNYVRKGRQKGRGDSKQTGSTQRDRQALHSNTRKPRKNGQS